MSLLTNAQIDQLSRRYSAADRHYHSLSHIEALLGLLERHRVSFNDPEAVEAAIWFHDAIYDSRAADNEEKSARLAREVLAGKIEPERLARIVRMIEATAGHNAVAAQSDKELADTLLFLDMDLSILGAAPDRYVAYEDEVRLEYAWVDEATWRARRADFLEKFLERDRLFSTDLFMEIYEVQARSNMKASLARLRQSA